MMKNIAVKLQYDGRSYSGFQRQPLGSTIQAEVEKAVFELTGEAATITGSGRTDAGVHALGQVINFKIASGIPPERWALALNTKLPHDIRAMASCLAPECFNSRYDAVKKLYKYLMLPGNPGNAVMDSYAWVTRLNPSIEEMRAGGAKLVGRRDFSSFRSAGSVETDPVRNLIRLEIESVVIPHTGEEGILFFFEADGFLYRMVRNLVGALCEYALTGGASERIECTLALKDRTIAPAPAPPGGLYLARVSYSEELDLKF